MQRHEFNLFFRRGTVLYMCHRALKSSEPHYFIVLNNPPYEGRKVVMSVVTSQINTLRERIKLLGFSELTWVELFKDCYPHLTKHSAVNCNDLLIVSCDEAVGYPVKHVKSPDFPQKYVSLMIRGVLNSPKVADEVKELLRGEVEKWNK